VVAHIVDRRFLDASVWLVLASAFSWLGWIHFSNQGDMSEAYLLSSIVTLLFAIRGKSVEKSARLQEYQSHLQQ
jgi:hypothetical protein